MPNITFNKGCKIVGHIVGLKVLNHFPFLHSDTKFRIPFGNCLGKLNSFFHMYGIKMIEIFILKNHGTKLPNYW